MLEAVEVRTRQGNLLTLTLEEDDSGLDVKDIEGLDPVKASLKSSSFARIPGEQYQGSQREKRNIKISLGLNPDPLTDSVKSLRNRLYQFLMPESEVSLRFVDDDGPNVDIDGVVETFETPLFSQEPAVDISIICFNPDFIDPTPGELIGTTVESTTESLIDYEGTVAVGFEFIMHVDRTISEFTLYHRAPDNTIRSIDFSAPLVAGDTLFISTVTGAKGATLTRLGSDSSILYGISPQSRWSQLMQGENYIRVYAEGAAIPFEINYITRYGGL